MATLGYIKDGVKGKVDLMPNSYPAEKVTYDNTTSGLTSDDAQDALDELARPDNAVGTAQLNVMNQRYQITLNQNFRLKSGSYISIRFPSNDYPGSNKANLSLPSGTVAVKVDGNIIPDEATIDPETGESDREEHIIKAGETGLFVYDGAYLNLVDKNGSSGHSILDQNGTSMAQEDSLQFADSFVSDDNVNGKTVIENIKEHATKADYDNATEDGFHVCNDGEDAVIHPSSEDYVEVTADGVKNIRQLLDELFALCDTSKISNESIITKGNEVYRYQRPSGTNSYMFITLYGQTSSSELDSIIFQATNSRYLEWSYKTSGNTVTEGSTTVILTSGTKITLYYGNKKAVVDLQTTANRCLMPDGTTVQNYLTDKETMYMAVENISLTTATRTFDFSSYFSGKSITKIKRQFAILMTADTNVELQRLSNTADYNVVLINKDNNSHSVYVGYYVFI